MVSVRRLRELYESGLSHEEVGRRVGLTEHQARAWLIEAGVPMRPPGRIPTVVLDDDDVVARYLAGASLKSLWRSYGVHHARITTILLRNGIEPVAQKTGRPRRFPQLHDRVWLSRRYATMTSTAIAAELGCGPSAVKKALADLDIPRRGPGQRAPHATNRATNTPDGT